MAWIDDRIWCHPKLTSLSDSAFRTYVNGIAYSAGMGTKGHLDHSQIKLVSSKKRDENELKNAKLWDENGDGIAIHDWTEHNAKRDERRAADRERKRLSRAKNGDLSAGQSADKRADSPQDAPQDTDEAVRRTDRGQNSGPAHVEGSEGSEGVTEEGSSVTDTQPAKPAVTNYAHPEPQHRFDPLTTPDYAHIAEQAGRQSTHTQQEPEDDLWS